MIGIVLAAGDATRLPNKPLLPLKNGRPAITSSIDYLLDKCCEIRIAIPPFSVIPRVLPSLYSVATMDKINFIVQNKADGVPSAMRKCVFEDSDFMRGDALVVMCDNIFPSDIDTVLEENRACVQDVLPWQRPGLLRWSTMNSAWSSSTGKFCFAGPLRARLDVLLNGIPGESTKDWLTRNAIHGQECKIPGWFDIGTPEMYTAYWSS